MSRHSERPLAERLAERVAQREAEGWAGAPVLTDEQARRVARLLYAPGSPLLRQHPEDPPG